MSDGTHDSADFLAKMDAGDFDQTLSTEIKKLSKEQLEGIANLLMERDSESTLRKPQAE